MDHEPFSLDEAVAWLRSAPDAAECLSRAHAILCRRFRGGHLETLARLPEIFRRDPRDVWARPGFLHCTSFNGLLKFLLVASGRFRPEDVAFLWTLIWCVSPHQYARVRVAGAWTDVDCWAAFRGVPLGRYAGI